MPSPFAVRLPIALLLIAVLLSACGASDAPSQGPTCEGDECESADTGTATDGGTTADATTATDSEAPDTTEPPDTAVPPDTASELGRFGDPCDENEECAAEICIDTSSLGRICTDFCRNSDQCPEGFRCTLLVSSTQTLTASSLTTKV
ncbi:MAG: hypothetical protein AAFX99_29720, partial [Myxococcota bacterium]